MLTGLQLASYWIGNFLFDVLRLQMLVIVTIACFIGFYPFISASIPVFIIWPLAIVPFIYGFAFFFEITATA